MRYGLFSILAVSVLTLAFTTARAQPASPAPQPGPFRLGKHAWLRFVQIPCPQGMAGPCWQRQESLDDGAHWFTPAPPPMAADPLGIARAKSCSQDSDCPGNARCLDGYCGRGNMACNSDADCKYTEFCDTSRPWNPHDPTHEFSGTCAPRGGHYPN
jgi:hypothetical protein